MSFRAIDSRPASALIKTFPQWCLVSSCLLLAVLPGCFRGTDNNRPARVPATGSVKLNGAPLSNATVIFQPVEHEYASFGTTDDNGRFQLRAFERNDGAVPGEFKIAILKHGTPENPDDSRSSAEMVLEGPSLLVPENYASAETSGLTANVEAGQPNEFHFELTGKLPDRTIPVPRRGDAPLE